jgi:hypothetical protein
MPKRAKSRKRRPGGVDRMPSDPSPNEIRALAAAIRRGWRSRAVMRANAPESTTVGNIRETSVREILAGRY